MPEPTRSARPWLWAALAFTIAWAMAMSLLAGRLGGGDAPTLVGTGTSALVDFGWPLVDVDGRPIDLAALRGRPIVVNVWASWCPPCRAEMPSLARLATDPRVRAIGAAVVCVSVDEDDAAFRRAARSFGAGPTYAHASQVPPSFATDGIPATVVIAPDGSIAASQVGGAAWDDPSVVAFLQHLAVPPPAPAGRRASG